MAHHNCYFQKGRTRVRSYWCLDTCYPGVVSNFTSSTSGEILIRIQNRKALLGSSPTSVLSLSTLDIVMRPTSASSNTCPPRKTQASPLSYPPASQHSRIPLFLHPAAKETTSDNATPTPATYLPSTGISKESPTPGPMSSDPPNMDTAFRAQPH